MKYLSALGYWLVLSSENSSKLSSTIKNGVPALVTILALFNVDTSGLPQVADFLADALLKVSAAILSVRTLWFSVRKVKLTLLGKNAVLNDPFLR